jgi:hypothetical protein
MVRCQIQLDSIKMLRNVMEGGVVGDGLLLAPGYVRMIAAYGGDRHVNGWSPLVCKQALNLKRLAGVRFWLYIRCTITVINDPHNHATR